MILNWKNTPITTHNNLPTQASSNSPQQPAKHTPRNTHHYVLWLPTPPTFGDKDNDGGANLNTPEALWMSANAAAQPSLSPD